MFAVITVVEIVALLAVLVADQSREGYAIRCIADGIFLGVAATHLVPGTALYVGTTSDLAFNAVFAFGFAYFLFYNYKRWKNAK